MKKTNYASSARASRAKRRYDEEEELAAAEEARWDKSYKPAATAAPQKPTNNNSGSQSRYESAQKAQAPALSAAAKAAAAGFKASNAAAQKAQSYASQLSNAAKGIQQGAASGSAAKLAAQSKQMAQNALKLRQELKRRNEQKAAEKQAAGSVWANAASAALQRAPAKPSAAEKASATEKAKNYEQGVISRPADPAGFVSAFEGFKFDKNPFSLIKPDGTSDLTPEQQAEASAIFNNVFDGESYLKYKEKQAAEKLAEQLSGAVRGANTAQEADGDKAATPIRPQSAREEIDGQRQEQLTGRQSDGDPLAMKKADEYNNKTIADFNPKTPMAIKKADEANKKIWIRFHDEERKSTPEKEKKAQNVIRDAREFILNAAEEFDVDPQIIASAIYAEQALNYDFKDEYLDKRAALMFDANVSLGVGQVLMSTASEIENAGFMDESASKKELIEKLSDDETNIYGRL